jgi:hypothetical protein
MPLSPIQVYNFFNPCPFPSLRIQKIKKKWKSKTHAHLPPSRVKKQEKKAHAPFPLQE